MWIGPCEAEAINAEMHGIKHPRPLTNDLLETIIQKANGKVRRVAVTHNKEGVYYATLTMEMGTTLLDIDARPSDSIVMALKFKAPVYVSKSLFSELSIPLTEPKEKKPATPIKDPDKAIDSRPNQRIRLPSAWPPVERACDAQRVVPGLTSIRQRGHEIVERCQIRKNLSEVDGNR